MINHNSNDVNNKVREVFPEVWDISIEDSWDKRGITITLKKSYDYVEVSFRQLEQLSIFFDTKNIDWNNGYKSEGCATCGSGSSYEVEIKIY